MSAPDRADVVVVGAGFGGLGAAVALAERGARVVLCEALNYPGGCASTFSRGGARFEAGATLFSGLGPEQLFGRWITAHQLPVEVDWLDPVVELRTPELTLPIPRDRAAYLDRLCALPGAPAERIRRLFAYQAKIADTLWPLLDRPELLLPLGAGALRAHLSRLPAYVRLLRLVGRPLDAVLRRFGVHDFLPLRTALDALCQITVQCGVAEAEAPFALSTMDYYFRGTGHVRGGIGELARGLCQAVERCGGQVRFSERVKALRRTGARWRVQTRRGEIDAGAVVVNALPGAARELLAPDDSRGARALARLDREVQRGWGAVMLYRAVGVPTDAGAGAGEPRHLELVADPRSPLVEGNHVFCSISGDADGERVRGQPHLRTLTASTHLDAAALRALEPSLQAARVVEVQRVMRRTLATLAPEWERQVERELTASPRTFARFTSRPGGLVGGIPRRAGLRHYLRLGPTRLARDLYLVGDTVFPGQSTLAAAVGGVKVADALSRR